MLALVALVFALPIVGNGCPHEGPDHRWFGRFGCQVQRQLTIERASPPRTIWTFHLFSLSVKIDPRHPHLLLEWPARAQKLWRFRAGYRWDANAKAYIFPALALKKVDGPMPEYQTKSQPPPKPKAIASTSPPSPSSKSPPYSVSAALSPAPNP